MKIVLDTNSLLVAIPKKSEFHSVFKGIFDGKFQLCITNEIIAEYQEVIERKTNHSISENIVDAILNSPFVEKVEIYYNFNLITIDPDDNKFVDCAIAAGVKYVVSNDKHYNILKHIAFPKVEVITIQAFLAQLNSC
jgi:uncharacterized protein